jgi:hypothetical protein
MSDQGFAAMPGAGRACEPSKGAAHRRLIVQSAARWFGKPRLAGNTLARSARGASRRREVFPAASTALWRRGWHRPALPSVHTAAAA